ncbi:hypothetical protein FNU76_10265 [Chitinimonas arctica]|uniref:Uncharacterized protein n=1 Tax=Chitinimonas arctica TaxID=2594795 RepID=A0A516SEY2_9NEIS|nr:hypothetical protein [Chitinimonas arctica]QDQ26717.1 hypothetical protein FNU76_10265 [Chitinimonas arctica]
MSAFVITFVEWEALSGIPDLAFRVYISLRRRMNFKTGRVGIAPARLSWQALAEDCETEGRQGRAFDKPSVDKLRYAVKQLLARGLLIDQKGSGSLVFLLPLARTVVVRSKEADTKLPTDAPQDDDGPNNEVPPWLMDDEDQDVDTHDFPEVDTTSGIRFQPRSVEPSSHSDSVLGAQARDEIDRATVKRGIPPARPATLVEYRHALQWLGYRQVEVLRLEVGRQIEVLIPLGVTLAGLTAARDRCFAGHIMSALYMLKVAETDALAEALHAAAPQSAGRQVRRSGKFNVSGRGSAAIGKALGGYREH